MSKRACVTSILVCAGILLISSQNALADIIVTIRGTIETTCTVVAPNLDFNFIAIDIADAPTTEMVKDVVVNCSGASDVRFSLTGTDNVSRIGLTPAGSSIIQVNDSNVPVNHSLVAGVNTLRVKVKLDQGHFPHGVFQPGAFTGSGTIVMHIN